MDAIVYSNNFISEYLVSIWYVVVGVNNGMAGYVLQFWTVNGVTLHKHGRSIVHSCFYS